MADFNKDFDINAAQDKVKVTDGIKALSGKVVTPWWRKKEKSKEGASDSNDAIVQISNRLNSIDDTFDDKDLPTIAEIIQACKKYEGTHNQRTRYTWVGQRRLDWVSAVKWRLVLRIAQACEAEINQLYNTKIDNAFPRERQKEINSLYDHVLKLLQPLDKEKKLSYAYSRVNGQKNAEETDAQKEKIPAAHILRTLSTVRDVTRKAQCAINLAPFPEIPWLPTRDDEDTDEEA